MARDIPDGFAAVALVRGAWGVRGEVKVHSLAARGVLRPGLPVLVSGLETVVERVTGSGEDIRLKFAAVHSREEAAPLRDCWVLVRESNLPPLPEGEFYRFQLLGLRVITTDGDEIGTITDIFSIQENDVYVVRRERGEALVPAIEDVVKDIDLARRTVTVEVIPGLLD